jgi:CysZ protein
VIRAFALSVGQLTDPRILGIVGRSLAITLLLFVAIGVVLGYALDGADPCGWIGGDSCPLGGSASSFGAFLLTAIGLWFLFPTVAIGVVAVYMDRVVAAVESRYYPASAETARPIGMMTGVLLGLRSSLRLLVYNLVALPFYLLLLITGIGTVLLFVLVNGVALGRDLGEMVAVRHLDRRGSQAWLRGTRGDRALMGMIVAGLFMVPIVNLLAPVLAAAMVTHLFHAKRATG